MSHEGDLSHRQERGKYLSSMHLTRAMMLGVILTGAAVLIWTFLLPALLGR